MAVRKLPIGIQSFKDIRESGHLYGDKTEYVAKLAEQGKPYFLGRPRRGKSLFLSTLKAYFEGRRDLFEEIAGQPQLAIARQETKWKQHPVIYLDLTNGPERARQLFSIPSDASHYRVGHILPAHPP